MWKNNIRKWGKTHNVEMMNHLQIIGHSSEGAMKHHHLCKKNPVTSKIISSTIAVSDRVQSRYSVFDFTESDAGKQKQCKPPTRMKINALAKQQRSDEISIKRENFNDAVRLKLKLKSTLMASLMSKCSQRFRRNMEI